MTTMWRLFNRQGLAITVMAVLALGVLCAPAAAFTVGGQPGDTSDGEQKTGTIKGHVEEGDESGLPPLKGPKKIVAVGSFENKSGFVSEISLGDSFSDMLANSLDKTGRFIVVNRESLDQVLDEKTLARSDETAKSAVAKTGQVLSAQYILVGAVTEFEQQTQETGGGIRIKGVGVGAKITKAHIAVVVRMINTQTSEEFTQRVEGKAQATGVAADYEGPDWGIGGEHFQKSPLGKAVQDALDQAVVLLGTRIINEPWTGKVVMAKDGKIYINAGERNGIKVGDVFVVYHRGEELRDPDTGELLDFIEEKLGTISVITVQEKVSICIEDELKEGAELVAGDVLKME
jgi:curli biogenesis system outer membrane secretion channel CsgG